MYRSQPSFIFLLLYFGVFLREKGRGGLVHFNVHMYHSIYGRNIHVYDRVDYRVSSFDKFLPLYFYISCFCIQTETDRDRDREREREGEG